MELLIMIDTCMRASAERITAVIPYYGYARQDRKDEGRVPITAKLVANMITRAGADRVLASADTVSQETIIGGPIEGKVALMFDDMISTAGSICGAADLVKRKGAAQIHVAATHGVLAGPAIERLRNAPLDSIVVTDSIPVPPEKMLPNMHVLSVAPMLGEAIKRIHHHESISSIFQT
jgi:ribose-phosphate pyrophosphokinase